MKKNLFLFLLIFAFSAAAYNFIKIADILKMENGKYVSLSGHIARTDFSGQYLTVKDDTGFIRVDLQSENIGYYGYDRQGINIKAWGYVSEDSTGKYLTARKIQVGGHFYYSN